MKSDKIFYTVYACPDDWRMAQAMSSVFSTYLSICSQNNFPAWLNFFETYIHPIRTYLANVNHILVPWDAPIYYKYTASKYKIDVHKDKKVAKGTKEVGFKNGVPTVYS